MKNRAAITGVGVIAPNAIGKEAFWQALADGKPGIKRITRFDVSSYSTQIAGEIRDFNPREYISPKEIRRLPLAAQFAVSAAKMAVSDAKLEYDGKTEWGVVVGVSSSATDIIEAQHGAFMTKGISRVSPFGVTSILPSASASSIVSAFGCKSSVVTISNACAAGTDAIGLAFRNIIIGADKIIIAGGVESQIHPFGLALLTAPGIMSKRNDTPETASRPFDSSRDGGVLSEGAGIIIVEDMEYALNRKAHIYAEIIGYASKADGSQIDESNEMESGIARSISCALNDANISPDEIDYVCAHGPSDDFDRIETMAIKTVLGKRAYEIPISSIKSMIGNPLSAAGPMQVIASIMVFENGIIPPTINHNNPDTDCDLDYVPNKARKAENINTVLINSHGFGGLNSSLIIRRFKQ
ncbi:MAG: beta-ketoacyl-[acyl-carrier-protein] synthase family protein [Candidatus Poribacteria bacterium]